MQSTGDIAAFRIGRCVPNKLKEREALPSNLRLQEPSYLGNEQQMLLLLVLTKRESSTPDLISQIIARASAVERLTA